MKSHLRILGHLPETLTSSLVDMGWIPSPDGTIALCVVADREEVFLSIRPLVQQGLSVVALGPVGDVPCAVSALRAGAQEYLERDTTEEALLAALERVAARRKRGGAGGVQPANAGGWIETLLSGSSVGLRTTATGAFSQAYLQEQFRRETWRCRRTGQPFSLAVLAQGPSGDPVAFAATVEDVAREVDVVAEIGPREWAVLLPETDRLGAALFRRRLWRSLTRGMSGNAGLPSSMGIASHPGEGDILGTLIEEAKKDAASFGASAAGRFRQLGFWDSVQALLSPAFLSDDTEGAAVIREVWREAARDQRSRCLLYLGGASLPPTGPGLGGGSRLHLLGSGAVDLPGGTVAIAADPAMALHQLVLYLGERRAYAFLRRTGGRTPSFHTTDPALVDHLVGALHDSYDLPP